MKKWWKSLSTGMKVALTLPWLVYAPYVFFMIRDGFSHWGGYVVGNGLMVGYVVAMTIVNFKDYKELLNK